MRSCIIKTKIVIVHVGPHKTGSTAIQSWFSAQRIYLKKNGVHFLHTEETHKIAKLLAKENYADAAGKLEKLSEEISKSEAETILISQEDFAGDLPGRSRKRGIYPRIAKNLRIIKRSLAPHNVEFVFFERSEDEWLRSCYHQNVVNRTQFSDFSTFCKYIGAMPGWTDVLLKAEASLKGALHRVAYKAAPECGVVSILSIVGIQNPVLPSPPQQANRSPGQATMSALERVNALTSFPQTAWFAKKLLLENWAPKSVCTHRHLQAELDDHTASIAFPELAARVRARFGAQPAEDLLPESDTELTPLAYRILPKEVELPSVSRANISDQSRLLDYHFRGKSELAKLNALAISYLRRDTPYTVKAQRLFHRIWKEFGPLLINELTSRWLISTLQTFMDHGENEAQRSIGTCGYFYGNLMKIYEGERAIEGLEQDGVLSGLEPKTAGKFRGLDRFSIGGTDLHLNVNALALEISLRDCVAGIVLQEFLLRVKSSGNAFTRADATRFRYNIRRDQFEDAWSFYVSPGPVET